MFKCDFAKSTLLDNSGKLIVSGRIGEGLHILRLFRPGKGFSLVGKERITALRDFCNELLAVGESTNTGNIEKETTRYCFDCGNTFDVCPDCENKEKWTPKAGASLDEKLLSVSGTKNLFSMTIPLSLVKTFSPQEMNNYILSLGFSDNCYAVEESDDLQSIVVTGERAAQLVAVSCNLTTHISKEQAETLQNVPNSVTVGMNTKQTDQSTTARKRTPDEVKADIKGQEAGALAEYEETRDTESLEAGSVPRDTESTEPEEVSCDTCNQTAVVCSAECDNYSKWQPKNATRDAVKYSCDTCIWRGSPTSTACHVCKDFNQWETEVVRRETVDTELDNVPRATESTEPEEVSCDTCYRSKTKYSKWCHSHCKNKDMYSPKGK
jgi:hypothetical protein